MNARAQQVSAANPVRQEYEREWTAMRAQRDREIRDLAETYKARLATANGDAKARKALRLEQCRAEEAIVKAYAPEDFGIWLHRQRERAREEQRRLHELGNRRQERGRQHELSELQKGGKLELQREIGLPEPSAPELKQTVEPASRRREMRR